jgi:hypothetical protein
MIRENHFGDVLDLVLEELKELRQTVAVLKANVESLEKRELLRVWGKANCRLCHPNYSEANPPISEWEQKFHDANHATGSPPKSFECFRPPTRNWEDVERHIAQRGKL